MTPCMGGWCAKREKCPHYRASGQQPAERLCERGHDGVWIVNADAFITRRVKILEDQAAA